MKDGVMGPLQYTVISGKYGPGHQAVTQAAPTSNVGDTTYQLGDTVSFLGATGKITKHEPGSWHGWDYEVTFDGGYTLLFNTEGYLHSFLKGAKLELVKKAEKPKVKKYRYAYERLGKTYLSDHLTDRAAEIFLGVLNHTKLEWTEMEEHDA